MLQSWLQIAVTLLIALAVSIPVGRYLSRVVTDGKTFLDPVLDPVDDVCTVHMLMTNLVMAVMIYLVLVFQDYLLFNPLGFPGVDPLLAFNTAVSFITNTDWQAYSGEKYQGGPCGVVRSMTDAMSASRSMIV